MPKGRQRQAFELDVLEFEAMNGFILPDDEDDGDYQPETSDTDEPVMHISLRRALTRFGGRTQ
jgi:hypothetical protein